VASVPNLIEIIKQAAIEAVTTSNPCAIMFGTVTSINPLKINVEQRLTLDASHLILTSLVRDIEVDMTLNHSTEEHTHKHTIPGDSSTSNETHKHDIKGKKTIKVHLGLKVGESVILLRVQGGQKYIVLDRVVI
jgi:hypothetical protein